MACGHGRVSVQMFNTEAHALSGSCEGSVITGLVEGLQGRVSTGLSQTGLSGERQTMKWEDKTPLSTWNVTLK